MRVSKASVTGGKQNYSKSVQNTTQSIYFSLLEVNITLEQKQKWTEHKPTIEQFEIKHCWHFQVKHSEIIYWFVFPSFFLLLVETRIVNLKHFAR